MTKIWIDALTPKQVLFFKPLKDELERRGYETFCTSRYYREVVSLAEKVGFKLQFIGRHGGKYLYEKLVSSCERAAFLADVVRNEKVDLALSFSSPESARVAFGLGIVHVCINDSPHSEKVARLTIPLSQMLFTPWIIPYSAWTKFGIERSLIFKYKALDPAAWLKRRSMRDQSIIRDLDLEESKKTILIRLEESYASYLLSIDESISKKLLDAIVSKFQDCNIVVLCRYKEQIEALSRGYGFKVKIPRDVVIGADLLEHSDVFIGMGGTMTAEAALLGIPTISGYIGERYIIENYLLKMKLIEKAGGIEDYVGKIQHILSDSRLKASLKKRAKNILNQMEDPIIYIADALEEKLLKRA